MATMGFTKAPSFVVRVGYVPMEPAARVANSHANCAAARARSSPFFLLAEPISGAVRASCPTSSCPQRPRQTFISRTCKGQQCLLRLFALRSLALG